jgi:hypothetical protein
MKSKLLSAIARREEIVMPKALHVVLLCSLVPVPFLGSSTAHGALIVNVETSKCLDVKFANTANGTPIRSVPCGGVFSQQWKWEDIFIKGIGTSEPGVGKCIDVLGGGTADGTLVQLFQCNGTGAQQWQFTNGRIVNLRSGKCLDLGDGSNSTQAKIRKIRFCNFASPSQNFALRS